MYTITRPETPIDKLPKKFKDALRAVQRDRRPPTPRQRALATAILNKGLRIITPYVGWVKESDEFVVSERHHPKYPSASQILEALLIELKSYGYELLTTNRDNYDRVSGYTLLVPPMAKCVNGHYTPYKAVAHPQAHCASCNVELWTTGPREGEVVLLWQGIEHYLPETLPVPEMIDVYYDFNGAVRPKSPLPPKGSRRRWRWDCERKRWNKIWQDISDAQVGQEIARGHDEWLRQEHDALLSIDPNDAIQGPVKFTPEMERTYRALLDEHAAAPFRDQSLEDMVLMLLYCQAKELRTDETLTFEQADRQARLSSDDYAESGLPKARENWQRAMRLGWRKLKRQLNQ